jgi:hypothetical protein
MPQVQKTCTGDGFIIGIIQTKYYNSNFYFRTKGEIALPSWKLIARNEKGRSMTGLGR